MRQITGQASLEQLLLVGFAIAILLPGIYFFYSYSQASQTSLSNAQYTKLGQEFINRARETIAQGADSWLKLDVILPGNIIGFNVSGSGSELLFTYNTPVGASTAVFFVDDLVLANASGNDGSLFNGEAHGGKTTFRFTATENGKVLIGERYS